MAALWQTIAKFLTWWCGSFTEIVHDFLIAVPTNEHLKFAASLNEPAMAEFLKAPLPHSAGGQKENPWM